MALTSKKRAFIVAVREGASNKYAAIAAGCSPKTASAAGSRLAKDPDVVSELHKLNALFPVGGDVKADVKTDVKPSKPRTAARAPKQASELIASAHKSASTPVQVPEPESAEGAGSGRVYSDPKDYLLDDMNDPSLDRKDRRDAAKALMPFLHARKGEGGKKEERQDAAKKAGAGKFSAAPPPPSHLRSVK